jgi:hypothetical protein
MMIGGINLPGVISPDMLPTFSLKSKRGGKREIGTMAISIGPGLIYFYIEGALRDPTCFDFPKTNPFPSPQLMRILHKASWGWALLGASAATR